MSPLDTSGLAVSAIGVVANEAFLAALVEESLREGPTPAGRGRLVDGIRAAVEASPYWPAFVAVEAADGVAPEDIGSPALGACVIAWARRRCHG